MEEVRGSSCSDNGEPDESHMNIPMAPFTNHQTLSSKTNELMSRRVMGAISATPTKDLLSNHSRHRLLLMDSELDTSTYGSRTPRKRKLSPKETEQRSKIMDTSSIMSKGGGTGGGSPFIFVAISGGKTLHDEVGMVMCNLENSECILSQVRIMIDLMCLKYFLPLSPRPPLPKKSCISYKKREKGGE